MELTEAQREALDRLVEAKVDTGEFDIQTQEEASDWEFAYRDFMARACAPFDGADFDEEDALARDFANRVVRTVRSMRRVGKNLPWVEDD